MVPDPNPTSERLLREYAKKRRDQAGNSPEIHPATRNMLQGEVVRIYGAATAESNKASATFILWQRIIWSTAAVGMLVLVFSVMFPLFKNAKNKPVEIAAMNRIRPESQLQSATAPNRLAENGARGGTAAMDDLSTVVQKEKNSKDHLSRVAIESDQPAPPAAADALADNFKREMPKPIASPAPSAITPAKEFSEKSEQVASRKLPTKSEWPGNSDQGRNKEVTASRTEGNSKAVAPAPPSERLQRARIEQSDSVMALAAAPEPGAARNFKQLDLRANYRQNLQSPAVPNVLSNFQVISTGTQLRIIDGDGSVYEGAILAVSKNVAEKLLVPAEPPQQAMGSARKTDAAPLNLNQSVSFRVSGENRTLHQDVVFEGTNLVLPLTPSSGALAKTSQPEFKKAAQVQLSVIKQKSLNPLAVGGALQNVIQGSVNIGGTNLYKIQAVESP